jgi:signal transduction histidine kinase/class 3 adenylate cyclase/ligand-binding sensor domain-containing protein
MIDQVKLYSTTFVFAPRFHPLRLMKRLFLPLLSLFLPVALISQTEIVRFDIIATKDGLPENSVRAIYQDHLGLLWLGTQQGLVKYNGYEMEVFYYQTDSMEQTERLIVNQNSIVEDPARDIWFGSGDRVFRLDRETEKLQLLTTRSAYITALYIDPDSLVWIATPVDGICRFKWEKDMDSIRTFSRYFTVESGHLPWNYVTGIKPDPEGNLWITTTRGLCRWQKEKESFDVFKSRPDTAYNPYNNFWDIAFSPDGSLWMGSYGAGLVHFNPESESFTHYLHKPEDPNSPVTNSPASIFMDSRQRLWMSYGSIKPQLQWLDTRSGVFTKITPQYSDPLESVATAMAFAPQCETRSGIVLTGTWLGGMLKYDPKRMNFHWLQHQPGNPNSLSSNQVMDIEEDYLGGLWICTQDSGLNFYDRKTKSFTHFRHTEGNMGCIASDEVWGIFEDSKHQLWIATVNGLDRYLRESQKFEHYLPNTWVISVMEDRKGRFWLGTLGSGLIRFDPETGHFQAYKYTGDLTTGPSSNEAGYFVMEDLNGILWCTNRLRPQRFYPETEKFEVITDFHTGSGGLLMDEKNDIWVSSFDGLGHLRVKEQAFQNYDPFKDFNNKTVMAIQEDDRGRIWGVGDAGMFCFDPNTESVQNFFASDGLPSNNLRLAYSTKSAAGELFFGCTHGMFWFHPDSIRRDSTPPLITFSKMEVAGEPLAVGPDSPLKQHISVTQQLALPYNENDLTIHYAALHYKNPLKNQYKVMMVGYDDKWKEMGTLRRASYTNLPPGKYTFRVIASNADGVWNERGISLKITIIPPWFWNAWSKILYLAFILTTLYFLYRWRTREQRKKLAEAQLLNERLLQVDKLKDQFLANTSHELRTPLQGIIGLSESLLEREDAEAKKEDLSMIISSGKRLNNLVNDILDFSKLKNFDIELKRKPVNLYVLVDVVLKNNAVLVSGKNLSLTNAVPRDLPPVNGDENRLQQILYNLVGNAIKFTEAGHIKVTAEEKTPPSHKATADTKFVIVSVEDTGIGIPENKREAIFQEFEQADSSISREFAGTGLGLSISKRLVELHGGEMWVESEINAGSTFFFTLPISKEKASTLSFEKPIRQTAQAVLKTVEGANIPTEEETIHILVVDDEPINQQVLKNHLAAGSYRVTQAMNGKEALQILGDDQTFDLVLLDIMMPKMSGYEVCEKIREKYLPSELPVIMVTAKNQVEDLVQGLAFGANDYITKPFSKDEFLARLKTQLDLRRIFDITGRFIPNEFIRALGKDRITDIALGDHTEKEVTVLFADIRDYTSLAETMTPEETYKFVNAFNGRMGPVIYRHRGFINQYLGDAIMAIFPGAVSDALEAAIEMQQVMQTYNERRVAKGRKPITVGMGMHTGSLIMGIIGDKKRMDAATIADTVNAASRLESLTKYYSNRIILSEVSYDQIEGKDQFHFRYLGKVQVKGKTEPMGIFECFDGDLPEEKQHKTSYAQAFQEGLDLYFSKNFPKASVAFQEMLQINPSDKTAQLFRDKAARFIHEGAPNDWDGVERMENK